MVYRLFYNLMWIFLVTLVLDAGAQAKPPYKIMLKRSYAVGMRTHEVIKVSNRVSFKLGNAAPRITQEDVKFECEITVITVESGHWRQLEVTPIAIDATAKGTAPIFSALNQPITATRNDGIVSFKRVDGKPLAVTDIQILKTCFVPAGQQTPDDLVGTDALKSAGDTWPVKAENLAKQLTFVSDGSMKCEAANTKGTMKLFKVWNLKGKTYLQVGGTVTYDPVALSGPKFQQLSEPNAKASLALSYQLPTDLSLPAAKMEEAFTLTIAGKQNSPDGPKPVVFETTSQRTRWLTVVEPNAQRD